MPPRSDGLAVDAYARGSRSLAIATAANPVLLAQARARLDSKIHTPKGELTRQGKISTWAEVARAAGYSEPFRLTPDLVYDVVAAMVAAKYRSIGSYISLATEQMVEDGGTVTKRLELYLRRARRAAKKGIGPPRRSLALPMERMTELDDSETPLCQDGPAHPRRVSILSSWWLMREIESANTTLRCVTCSPAAGTVNLPPTKTEQQGFTVSRTLGCTGETAPTMCPAHLLAEQVEWVERAFPHLGRDAPLFPTCAGKAPRKEKMVTTIVESARKLGLAVVGPTGAALFGGHSWRPAGAQYLAKAGIDTWRIQIHGRWGSEAIAGYIADTPLSEHLAIEAALGKDLDDLREAITHAKAKLHSLGGAASKERLDEVVSEALDDHLVTHRAGTISAAIQKPTADDIAKTRTPKWFRNPSKGEIFVKSTDTGKLHAAWPPVTASTPEEVESGQDANR